MSTPDVVRTFRVRRYECDAYGHVNNTTYLRYLEETEHEVGLDPGGALPLLTTDIEFVEPLAYGDEVTVTARTRETGPMVREYEFRRQDGTRVAGARAGWGEEGTQSGQEILAAPEPPAEVFMQRRQVEWRDVDERARVSPATLSAFAEDCGVDLCAAYGWPLDRCTDEGFAIVLRRHQIAYAESVRLGDELEIRTWASDLKRAMAVRHYLLASEGKEVARFRSQYVWIDISSRRPIRIPASFLEDFRPNFSGPAR